LLETEGELVIIDQHAAHERILFEELLNKKPNQKKKMPSQLLLKPLKLNITQLELAALTEYQEQIQQLGFDYENFGPDSIVIRAVPEVRSELNPELAFSAVIEACVNENITLANGRQDLLHDIACKAAVKAHDRLDCLEIKRLLSDLQNLENPYHCPHGRPVLIRFSRHDLDKMFKRIIG
jgi:DNA mismatch repair protein MutL